MIPQRRKSNTVIYEEPMFLIATATNSSTSLPTVSTLSKDEPEVVLTQNSHDENIGILARLTVEEIEAPPEYDQVLLRR